MHLCTYTDRLYMACELLTAQILGLMAIAFTPLIIFHQESIKTHGRVSAAKKAV